MEKIYGAVSDLTKYALATELIEKEDVIYTVNSLLGALGIDDYPGNKEEIIEGAGKLSRAGIEDGTLLIDALVASGISKSKGDARKLIQQGAVSVNGEKAVSLESRLMKADAVSQEFSIIKKGKKNYFVVTF